MKKSIRVRAFAPALSVLSLAVAASVQAQGIEVNPVVVSASRMEQPLSDVLSSVSVITRADIDKSQAASLADLLQGQAGFEFARYGGPGATTSLFLRGQDSKNVAIFVDGVRTQVDAYSSLTVTDMPLSQIDRIEVLHGNAGALYGESAIGGVINIYTRKGKGDPKGYGSISYGSRNTSNMNVGYGGRQSDYSFNFNAGHEASDGMSSIAPATSVNPDKDGYRKKFLAGNVDKKISNDLTIGLRFNANWSAVDTDDAYALSAQDIQQFKTKNESVGMFVRQAISDKWVSVLDLTDAKYTNKDMLNGVPYSAGDLSGYNGLMKGNQKAARWSNTYQLQPKTQANFGLDYQDEKFSAMGDAAYEVKRQTSGYFAGVLHQVDKLSIQTNLRRDGVSVANTSASGQYQSNDSSATTGLIGVGYQLEQNWRLTSSVSTGFRAPAAAEISSSPSLKPEKHQSEEVGIVYSAEKTLARLTYFESSTKDAIGWAYTGNGSCTQNCYENIAQASNKGFESSVRSQWMGNSVNLSLTFQDPINEVTGKQLSLRARHYGSFDISRPVGGYEIGSKVYASGARANAGPMGGGYALVSFYVSRKIDNDWTARVKLENAFDREYQLIKGYNTPGRGIYATLQYQPK